MLIVPHCIQFVLYTYYVPLKLIFYILSIYIYIYLLRNTFVHTSICSPIIWNIYTTMHSFVIHAPMCSFGTHTSICSFGTHASVCSFGTHNPYVHLKHIHLYVHLKHTSICSFRIHTDGIVDHHCLNFLFICNTYNKVFYLENMHPCVHLEKHIPMCPVGIHPRVRSEYI